MTEIHQPIFKSFDKQHEICATNFLQLCPSRLKLVTTLPCEIRKTFLQLKQYDNIRNVTDSTRVMQSWNTRQATSKHCSSWPCARTKASSVYRHWSMLHLLHSATVASRGAHHLPLICHVLYWRVVGLIPTSLLNAVIDLFNVQAVGGHVSAAVNMGFSRRSSSTVSLARWASALSYWTM